MWSARKSEAQRHVNEARYSASGLYTVELTSTLGVSDAEAQRYHMLHAKPHNSPDSVSGDCCAPQLRVKCLVSCSSHWSDGIGSFVPLTCYSPAEHSFICMNC